MELGLVLDGSRPPSELLELARAAERHRLAMVVVDSGDLDPWTLAVWLAGSTDTIPVVVPAEPDVEPVSTDPATPYPQVVAHAARSADTLAPGRLTRTEPFWVRAEAGTSAAALRDLAGPEGTVVVEVADPEEVARLARELGLDERPATRRSPAVRARRRPGIDYDGVPASLAERAVEPGDPGYQAVSSTYLRGGAPGLVLRPRTPEEVADALAFASRHRHLPLGVRSAGHGISGRSTNRGGLVVDVGAMDEVTVLDRASRLVRVGPGATWKKVARTIGPRGWAITSGDYGGVGVGGLATAGGIGLLSREQGLTIDRVRAVELVLADGQQVRASATENPDLFWAVRGAGASFGVATAFEIEAGPVSRAVGFAQLVLVVDDIADALVTFGEVASAAPRDTTVFLVTGRPQGGRSVVQLFGVVDSDDGEVVVERLNPFVRLGLLAQQDVRLVPYADAIGWAPDVGPEGHHGFGEPVSRSAFVDAVTPALARDAADLLRSGAVHFFQLRTMGGAIADVDPQATAFAHRHAAFNVAAMGSSHDALRPGWERVRQHADGLYLSFETDTDPARLADAFPPDTLARLRELKRRYDPEQLLRDNFAIDPATPVAAQETLS